jgi:hypothetical protein
VYRWRLEHALRRIEMPAALRSRPWEGYLLLGHAIDYFALGSIHYVRDLVASHDQLLLTPFTERALIDRFHRCRVATRYVDGGRTKPVLKEMLARLLPAYPLDRAKLASGLPRTRYFQSGPLARAFDRYPPPEPLASVVAGILDAPARENTWVLWPALTYSIWYHEACLREAEPRADLVSYRFAAEPDAAASARREPAAREPELAL